VGLVPKVLLVLFTQGDDAIAFRPPTFISLQTTLSVVGAEDHSRPRRTSLNSGSHAAFCAARARCTISSVPTAVV